MKLFTTFLFFLSTSIAFSQELDGLWFSSCRMNIQKRTESSDIVDGKIITKKLDTARIDTFYHRAESVLNFLPNNEVEIKGLGQSIGNGTYEFSNDTILAKIDTVLFKLVRYNDKLLLVDLDSGWQYNQFVFERLLPKSSSELFIPDFNSPSYWKIESDSIYHGWELVILDSTNIIMSLIEDGSGYTSWGSYKTDSYDNSLYFYYIDRYLLNDELFRLFDWNSESFKGQAYALDIFSEYIPTLHNFVLKKRKLPSKKELKHIRAKLVNSWTLNEGNLPFDSDFADYDTVKNDSFKLVLTESDFEIIYGGDFYSDNKSVFLENRITGTWVLGLTGKYIEFKFSTGLISYLTILELDDNYFAFDMSLESPDSSGFNSSDMIKLKRH